MISKNKKYTFFWDGPFSQWYASEFVDARYPFIVFNCAEQYMMWNKAKLMNDTETMELVLLAKHPRQQKALGRKVKNFDAQKWDDAKENIVLFGNYCKFTQNTELKEILLATEGTTLVEASPFDKIWGIGLAENDPRAEDETQWQGLNLLGKVLTRLRESLLAGKDIKENG